MNNSVTHDDGMVVQTTREPLQQILKDAASGQALEKPQSNRTPAKQKTLVFRPINRQPVAKLIVLDDGSREHGEEIHIRQSVFMIGREKGDLKIPFDRDISSQHAELRCHQQDGKFRWYLIDHQSRNGTFLRAYKATLSCDAELIMGSRRYLFKLPESPGETVDAQIRETYAYQAPTEQQLELFHPRLIEMGVGKEEAQAFLMEAKANTIGRAGTCAVHITKDSFLSPQHAKLQKDERGHWMISDMKSTNGVWIRVRRVPIDRQAEFQIGYQRFLFYPQNEQK